jgi:hypothetical protein
MRIPPLLSVLLTATCLALAGCNYDSSLTSKPTQPVNEKLLGDWQSVDKDTGKVEVLHVRRLDDSNYAVAMDGDIYRAFHSDFAGIAFMSVQDLQVGREDHKYVYFTWQLSADGTQLTLHGISTKVVPEETKGRTALQKLIKANLKNPELFTDAPVFKRPPPR